MASHIVGISGRKRSGKDTFAARLVSHHGFTRVSFADPLKAVAMDVNPIVYTLGDQEGIIEIRLADVLGDVGDWETAKELPEVRRILQTLGVAVRDHVDPEAWVDAAWRVADGIPGPVVITDVRFPNEVQAVRRWGGKIVRVNRPGLPETDLHISETALDALVADYVVHNDADVAALHLTADSLAASL
jgi:hypothetical protein